MQFDTQLAKAAADTGEMKALADKLATDATAQKAQYDTQLAKAEADAGEMKALADKLATDATEQKMQFDTQLAKAEADAGDMRALANKLASDATEQKAVYDEQLAKAEADTGEMRALADKLVLDASEQKAQYDNELAKAHADAGEMKALAEKVTEDAQRIKALADERADQLGALTAAQLELQAQHDQLEAKHKSVESTLEQQRDENKRLMKAQEVLQAELQLALNSYRPKAVIDAGTPADKVLAMMSDLLDGSLPSIQDILFVQSAILESLDIYQPMDVGKQLMQSALDRDVSAMLMAQLSSSAPGVSLAAPANKPAAASNGPTTPAAEAATTAAEGPGAPEGSALSLTLADFCRIKRDASGRPLTLSRDGSGKRSPGQSSSSSSSQGDEPYSCLESALTLLLAPGKPEEEEAGDMARSDLYRSGSAGLAGPLPFSPAGMLYRRAVRGLMGPEGSAAGPASGLWPGSRDSSSPRFLMPSVSGRSGSQLAPLSDPNMGADLSVHRSGSVSGPVTVSELQPRRSATQDPSASQAVVAAEAYDTFPSPTSPILEEVERVLSTAYNWQFDAFKLSSVSGDRPLSALAFFLFHEADLIKRFQLKAACLARFLRRIEDGYRANPYHNKMHAADVLQTMHVLLHRGGLVPGYADPLYLMACYIAAIIHDYEHLGLTNDFLVNSAHELAILYNDKCPLENHHLAAAFSLLRRPGLNFLSAMPKADFDKLRKLVIELVLATDMKSHFSIISHFSTVHRINTGASTTASTAGMSTRRRSGGSRDSSQSAAYSGILPASDMDKIVVPLDEAERMLSLQVALKCSDLGHVSAALPVHLKWVRALEEEFFRQGDRESAGGLPVSPLFDRHKQGISKSQVGFFDIVVIPLYQAFSQVFGSSKPLLTYVMRNYKYWAQEQAVKSTAATGGNPPKP